MPLFGSRGAGAPGPDYVGAGAEDRCAAWWHELLLRHPQVDGPRGKAPALHFFDEFCYREPSPSDLEGYARRFKRGGRGHVSGEWTGRYLCDGWTPRLLGRAAPEAKVLVILRDPVERFREVLAERRVTTKAAGKRLVTTDVVDRSFHAFQLRRLYGHVPPERVLVLQYERCVRDGEAEYRRTLEFLGVDAEVPAGVAEAAAAGLPAPPHGAADLWPDLEASLHAALDDDVRELAGMVGHLDLALWPHFAQVAAAAPASP